MPRRTTKTKTTSKKKAVKKPKKVQLEVRVAQKPEAKIQKPEEIKIESKKAVVVKEKIEKKQTRINKQVDFEKIERDKRLIMWTGVIFFMVLIFGAWTFNLKNVFKSTPSADIDGSVVQEWDEISDEFSKTWEKVREGMAELKTVEDYENNTENTEDKSILEEIATSTNSAEKNELEELKARLKELEGKIDGQQATSTP